LRAAVVVGFLVEQVELQFRRHHRVITIGLEPVDHPGQHVPGVGHGGGQAFGGVHADLHRRRRNQPPWHALQTAADRVGATVDIAHLPHQPGVFHVIAMDGQAKDGAGQRAAAFIHRQQFVAMQQLAARTPLLSRINSSNISMSGFCSRKERASCRLAKTLMAILIR